jgi:predicted secreted protein
VTEAIRGGDLEALALLLDENPGLATIRIAPLG